MASVPFVIVQYITRSSVNSLISEVMSVGRSFMYIMNKMDERLAICGTPDVTSVDGD